MNKYFLSLLLVSSWLPIMPQCESHAVDVLAVSNDSVPFNFSSSLERDEDGSQLIMAFDALRHIAANHGIGTPYSHEYIDYLCSDSFKAVVVSKLKNK